MISPLRRRHGRIVIVLCAALPIGFAAAILAREREAPLESLPRDLARTGPAIEAPMHARDDAWGDLAISMRTGRTAGRAIVELEPRAQLRVPDLLVYWTAAAPPIETLPPDAHLLGALGEHARRYVLPLNADAGALVLFSMARSEVIEAALLPR